MKLWHKSDCYFSVRVRKLYQSCNVFQKLGCHNAFPVSICGTQILLWLKSNWPPKSFFQLNTNVDVYLVLFMDSGSNLDDLVQSISITHIVLKNMPSNCTGSNHWCRFHFRSGGAQKVCVFRARNTTHYATIKLDCCTDSFMLSHYYWVHVIGTPICCIVHYTHIT